MKQCTGCETQKKADNCIRCAQNSYSLLRKILIDFHNILESPTQDYKKVDKMKDELSKYMAKKQVSDEKTNK